jgi:hypothetical protein
MIKALEQATDQTKSNIVQVVPRYMRESSSSNKLKECPYIVDVRVQWIAGMNRPDI